MTLFASYQSLIILMLAKGGGFVILMWLSFVVVQTDLFCCSDIAILYRCHPSPVTSEILPTYFCFNFRSEEIRASSSTND